MPKRKTPYQRIVAAAKELRGVRLTPDEVWFMGSMDEAIIAVARNDDDADMLAEARAVADRLETGGRDA